MKIIKQYDDLRIPDYALPYIINGDSSGLSDEDKQNIDTYMQQYYSQAKEEGVDVIFSTIGTYEYFTSHPAFGLACNVIECSVLIVED